MRMNLSDWADREFLPSSRPSDKTLRRMAKDGEIPGAYQVKTRWYVNVDQPNAIIETRLKALAGDDPLMKKAMGLNY